MTFRHEIIDDCLSRTIFMKYLLIFLSITSTKLAKQVRNIIINHGK